VAGDGLLIPFEGHTVVAHAATAQRGTCAQRNRESTTEFRSDLARSGQEGETHGDGPARASRFVFSGSSGPSASGTKAMPDLLGVGVNHSEGFPSEDLKVGG
jgi:hypothetical protein